MALRSGRSGRKNTDPNARTRPSEKEVEERVAEAEGLMLRGWTDRRVAAEIAHKYAITVRAGFEYVYRVREMWKERLAQRKEQRDPDEVQREHRDRCLFLFDLSVKKDDHKTAGMMVQRLMELDGLGTSRKVEIGGKLTHDVAPDIAAMADEVLRRHGYEPPKEGGEGEPE